MIGFIEVALEPGLVLCIYISHRTLFLLGSGKIIGRFRGWVGSN